MAAEFDWIWYELMTTDPHTAARFYEDVVGWNFERYPGPDDAPVYLVGAASGRGIVGLMAMPAGVPAGVPPSWGGYVQVADADTTARAITRSGGNVLRPPFNLAGVGRLAVVADPEGGVFNLLQPNRADAPPMPDPWTPGNISWRELHSRDPENNFAWYQGQFGWQLGEAHDMGPNGTYQIIATDGLPGNGGSCGKMSNEQPTHWLFYFAVDAMDAAVERARKGGGEVFMGPHEVPGNTWIAIGRDPQGAVFALHAQSR